jgi:RNA polymerase sigma-70 factor, ECF subfamily
MSSMSVALTRERQMCAAVIQPPPVSSELLRELYITHHCHVLQTCRKFFRQPEDAEDAAAEVFLKLYRVLHQKDELVPFRPWLSQIAAHHCIDKLRRRKHEKNSVSEEVDVEGLLDHSTPSALSEVLRNEAEGQVRQALTSLPEKHRIVLVLHYYDRMHYSQIANALNVSLSAVRVRIFRAKRFLRCKLGRTHRRDTLARLDPEPRQRRKAELTPFRISNGTTNGQSEFLTGTTGGHSDRSRPTPFPSFVRERVSLRSGGISLPSVAPQSTSC